MFRINQTSSTSLFHIRRSPSGVDCCVNTKTSDLTAEVLLIFGKPANKVCLMMTSLKTKYLLFLAAFLFLTAVPTVAEVVRSMADCKGFLLNEKPPQVPGILKDGNILDQNRYKPICQTYENQRRFLTLYDTTNRIPVFSAYKYNGVEPGTSRPREPWKIEPQLESHSDQKKEMVAEEKDKRYNNQALNTDYSGNGVFDKGHLFPSSFGFDTAHKKSTFTLTNAVPQRKKFNQVSWSNMEQCVRCIMDKSCINSGVTEGFVVTGAKPDETGTKKLNDRVNIPLLLWTAFCCKSSEGKWIASAHWGDNTDDEPVNKYLQSQTLADLHKQLKGTNSAPTEFEVFPGSDCPLHNKLDGKNINGCSQFCK